MTGKIHIREAGVADAHVITTLGITTFTETFAADNKKEDMDKYLREEMSLECLAAELADKSNTFYLAFYDGAEAGFAKVRATKISPQLAGQNALEIERLYVLQQHHGHKIGAALMGQCLQHAGELGCSTAWLGVWEHNRKAIAFYQRWGFEPFGSHIFRLGDDEQTDMLMKKALG